MPQFLSAQDADFESRFAALLGMKREEAEDVDQAVAAIAEVGEIPVGQCVATRVFE